MGDTPLDATTYCSLPSIYCVAIVARLSELWRFRNCSPPSLWALRLPLFPLFSFSSSFLSYWVKSSVSVRLEFVPTSLQMPTKDWLRS